MSLSHLRSGPLPVPSAPLYGRADEIARIPRWMGDGARIVTLTGLPGSGKTRLSLHVAGEVQRDTGWPALFLPMVPLSSADQIMGSLARALEVRDDARGLADRVCERLIRLGPVLLVLDNLEHLEGAGDVIGGVAHACPDARIIATSRTPLRVHGERRLPVEPFARTEAESSRTELRAHPAVQLFVARTAAGSHIVTDADLPTVAAICDRLEGLPLAIELAAARASTLGVARLRASLEHSQLDLAAEASDPRHRSLRSAIGWSYDLLDPPAREALERLSVFAGGFGRDSALRMLGGAATIQQFVPPVEHGPWFVADLEAIARAVSLEAIAGSLDGAIQQLIEGSLIQVRSGADGEIRYEMLESIREFGLERLDARGASGQMRHAHAVTMLQYAEIAGHDLWTRRAQSSSWRRLVEEQGNLNAALAWSCDPAQAQPTLAARLSSAVWFHFQLSGSITEAREWMERAAALPGASLPTRAQMLNGLAFVCWAQGDVARSQKHCREVIDDLSHLIAPEITGMAEFNLALGYWRTGDLPSMTASLLSAKQRLAGAGDRNGEGFCNLALGMLARLGGDRPQAEHLLAEGYRLHTEAGHLWGAATARYFAGEVAHDAGEIVMAAERIGDGMKRYWSQGDLFGSGACVSALAVLAAERSEFRRAARLFGAASAMCEHVGAMLPPVDLERYHAVSAQVIARGLESEYAVGRGWSADSAVAEALALAAEIAAGKAPVTTGDAVASILSVQQLQAVNLLCGGMEPREIAAALNLRPNAIYGRLDRACKLLDVKTYQQLVAKVNATRADGPAA